MVLLAVWFLPVFIHIHLFPWHTVYQSLLRFTTCNGNTAQIPGHPATLVSAISLPLIWGFRLLHLCNHILDKRMDCAGTLSRYYLTSVISLL